MKWLDTNSLAVKELSNGLRLLRDGRLVARRSDEAIILGLWESGSLGSNAIPAKTQESTNFSGRKHNSFILEDGFTGEVTDSAGRKRYYRDGKQVSGPGQDTPADQKPSHSADKMKSLMGRIAEVPKQVVEKVGGFIQKRFESLSAKYGKTGARLIVAGMIALAPTPIPGSSLIPVALASVVKRLFGGSKSETRESMEQPLPSGEDLVVAIREALAALYAEMGEQAPDVSDEDVQAFLAEYQQHAGEPTEQK